MVLDKQEENIIMRVRRETSQGMQKDFLEPVASRVKMPIADFLVLVSSITNKIKSHKCNRFQYGAHGGT